MSTNAEQQQMEQVQALNKLLLEMNKNQKKSNNSLIKTFIVTVVCFTVLLISMVLGFFWYESQFEMTEKVVTETITQEVSGTDSEINSVEGNLYKDNASHTEERSEE